MGISFHLFITWLFKVQVPVYFKHHGLNVLVLLIMLQWDYGTDGNLMWRFYKQMNEGVFSSGNEMMERMMRKVARNFPYLKD